MGLGGVVLGTASFFQDLFKNKQLVMILLMGALGFCILMTLLLGFVALFF